MVLSEFQFEHLTFFFKPETQSEIQMNYEILSNFHSCSTFGWKTETKHALLLREINKTRILWWLLDL